MIMKKFNLFEFLLLFDKEDFLDFNRSSFCHCGPCHACKLYERSINLISMISQQSRGKNSKYPFNFFNRNEFPF